MDSHVQYCVILMVFMLLIERVVIECLRATFLRHDGQGTVNVGECMHLNRARAAHAHPPGDRVGGLPDWQKFKQPRRDNMV